MARHGQTESNLLSRYAGFSSEPITRVGRAQMMDLATRLELCGIAEIWTSDVARAQESADLVGQVFRVPVRADPRLNEMRLGPWEGLTEVEVAATFPAEYALWCAAPDQVELKGRETLTALADRVANVVLEAARQCRPVLLMTHVAPIRVAVLTTLGVPLRYYRRMEVRNGECVIVDRDTLDVSRLVEARSLRSDLPGSQAREPLP